MLINPLFLQNLLTSYAALGGVALVLLVLFVLLLCVSVYVSVLSVQLWKFGTPPVPSPRANQWGA